mmetsp:Transcript_2557/g.6497  ORF Transcript_2557/g.6497 Transcript_2557/m.6497 type:complete len:473 (+) Transcript_2557:58-1476(+)
MSTQEASTGAMPSFISAVANANDKYICTAKASDVGKVKIRYLLERQLKVPIFQRRYCWNKDQWSQLFDDVTSLIQQGKEVHSLGRITCAVSPAEGNRLLVIDGQQRNTTSTLLLAAIRDAAHQQPEGRALADELNGILMPDASGLQRWLQEKRCSSGKQAATVEEGECLDFMALLPTYCDRAPFFSAVLPPEAAVITDGLKWQRPLQAKKHFEEKLRALSVGELHLYADAVLTKLEWLFFPLDLTSNYGDGTDDLQVIFERLAIRDAAFCRPSRSSEFVGLGAADFVRNLLLGSFPTEAESIRMYEAHWLPMEMAAGLASQRTGMDAGTLLEKLLESFLKAQPKRPGSSLKPKPPSINAGLVGGPLYPRFRRWFSDTLNNTEEGETRDRADTLTKTVAVLVQLQSYASNHFASGNDKNLQRVREPELEQPLRQRCKMCRTSCPGSARKCLGCGMALLPPVPPGASGSERFSL